MIENFVFLAAILSLTFSVSNENYKLGVLVSCYYALYICLDLSYWGYVGDFIYDDSERAVVWYLIQFALTMLVFIASITLLVGGNNSAGLYAVWLLIAMLLDGVSSVFQLAETNSLLMVYNKIQNISVYVDLFVVFIGMDHIIKRKHRGSRIFIERVNHYLDAWRFISILQCGKGAKCNKKN